MYRTPADRQLGRMMAKSRRSRLAREQAALTPAEIRARIVAAILEADTKAQPLDRSALMRTNIPASSIDEYFAACMNEAERQAPGLKDRVREYGA